MPKFRSNACALPTAILAAAKFVDAPRRLLRWLIVAAIASLAINALLLVALVVRGTSASNALSMTTYGFTVRLKDGAGGVDSLRPMLGAWNRALERPDGDIYGLFLEERTKFQYPPSSLLIFTPLPRALTTVAAAEPAAPLRRAWGFISQGLVLLTILASAAILELSLRGEFPDMTHTRREVAARVILASLLGATFFPVTRAHNLGQIQVLLNAAVACGVLFRVAGWRTWSGACFGVCCVVKPQFGVVLLWSVVRREWRFFTGLAAVALPLVVLSLLEFGFANHVRYVQVIRAIARTGESFWPNQSMNGILNRLLGNGDAVTFSRTEFPPFDPLVYAATTLSGLLILGAALWAGKRWCAQPGGALDLAVVVAAATIASPVAWEHHYGAFLPLFALVVPICIRSRPFGRWTVPLLALSFLAMANVVRIPEWLFASPARGVLGSHLFFGALTFLCLLFALRARRSGHAADA